MMHHVLNDSTTDFIHRLALKTKHWLPRTGHSRPKVKNSICSVQYVSQRHSKHPATPTYLELISNICLINGNFKDNFCYIVYILPDIRQL